MADFRETRIALQQTRARCRALEAERFRIQERKKKIERKLQALTRVMRTDDSSLIVRLDELQAQVDGLEQEIAAITADLEISEAACADLVLEFSLFTDPREFVEQLNDRHPFLLFPLRIETRFKRTATDAAGNLLNELWVRVFPDDALIDSFEEHLSESELEGVRLYWLNFWKAGAIEAQQRAAWRGLVDNFGAGRSAYLLEQYTPINQDQIPTKDNVQDIILVIGTESPIPAAEQEPIRTFWTAVWLADGLDIPTQAAFADLANALGEARAREIVDVLAPFNLPDLPPAPFAREEVNVQVAFLQFPPADETDTQEQSWSRAPRVNLMPDRLVFMGYNDEEISVQALGNPIPNPLFVGPDPLAEGEDQLRAEDGELKVSEALKWMVDFETAVSVGMGFKIPLDPIQFRRGFDRIIILGVRLSADESEASRELETLFRHHHFGANGFGFLPQGTPTNNSEQKAAGYSLSEDADDSFRNYVLEEGQFELTEDWMLKRDGQVLAEMLGVDPEVFQRVPHAGGRDQCEARALNVALWPATIGYFMESMMQPVFSENAIRDTRSFFTRYVSGRGALPAIRVGDQPYGILPTAAFSKLAWFRAQQTGVPDQNFFGHLHRILHIVQTSWNNLQDRVAFVGKRGPDVDAHQVLLDAVGLHAGSVNFYQRYAESFIELYHRFNAMGHPQQNLGVIAFTLRALGYQVLAALGYNFPEDAEQHPEILEKYFYTKQNILKGPFVDDRPPSETDPIRAYTEDDRNYIQWLIDACRSSHDVLRKQEGFLEDKPPAALLYLLLQHALDLGYVDASLVLHLNAQIIQPQQAFAARIEPAFLHIRDNTAQESEASVSESKWRFIYKADQRITNTPDLPIAEYIPQVLNTALSNSSLNRQLAALEHLQDTPTARLERLLTEHLDCCNYRIDAWKLGMLHYQLTKTREITSNDGLGSYIPPASGVPTTTYLGAFGWLENVRSENKVFEEVDLNEELADIFNAPGAPPVMRDNTNAGYIHAPSLNHAVTAAILRNGYLSNATPDNPETLKVNLSSERVRKALGIIEGIRNGQSLAALLGYQFERILHESEDLELDFYIHQIRKAFPLASGRFKGTRTDGNVSIKAVEARNVVDGLELINHVQETGNAVYPFGKELSEEGLTNAVRNAISAAINHIADMNDAISDLAIAESVHQVVQGNYDRAAATLDTYSKGNFPPIPDVIKTPRSGKTITHRFAIHLEAGLGSNEPITANPRRIAEPAVDNWLRSILPPAADIVCRVNLFFPDDPDNGAPHQITAEDLGLDAIDLLYLLNNEAGQEATTLDELIFHHVLTQFAPRPDVEIRIVYTERIADHITFFELNPLLQSLRAILLRSRPLKAGDILLPIEATDAADSAIHFEDQRLVALRTKLGNLASDLQVNLINGLAPQVEVEDIIVNQDTLIANIDQWAEDYINLLQAVGLFGFLQPSIAAVFDKKRKIYRQVMTILQDIRIRWEDKLADFDARVLEFNELPPEATNEEALDLLQFAESAISTDPLLPLPNDPLDFSHDLEAKRTAFESKLNDLVSIINTNTNSLADLLQEIEQWISGPSPAADFDAAEIALDPVREQILVFAEDLLLLARSLHNDLTSRDEQAQEHLEAFANAAASSEKSKAIDNTAKVLLSEDFKLFPEFIISDQQQNEWLNGWNDRLALLSFQQTEMNNAFPVDDWLHGVARVRGKMQHWEKVSLLAEALSGEEPVLDPLQFPYRADDRWLAMEFLTETEASVREEERGFKVDSDRLLYTAHYAAGQFQAGSRQCGLLVDEWTEVIPTLEETTGVAFHYDRPNSEPPQTLLLVLPTNYNGRWQWNDIVDALNETLEMAKMRAIEPDQIDDTPYSRLLPATISSTTGFPITSSLNYSLNNQFYTFISDDSNE